MSDLISADLRRIASDLQSGANTSRSITEWYLDRIAQLDDALNAFVSVDQNGALRLADASDARRAAGHSLGPLDGVPIALKDLCDVEGQITTAGSKSRENHRATTTATVAHRLIAAGMVVLGKTQMVEFAFGGWGTNPHMGTPRNPWDMAEHRIPGGSSSGSGVAVAAGLAPVALGSDTGGSIRIPAAVNGVTGLKTSRGRIDMAGTVPLSPTLDTLGFLARTAEDALLVTAAVRDPQTPWEADILPISTGPCPLAGIRIAVPSARDFPTMVDGEVLRVFDEAADTLRQLGAKIESVGLPFDFGQLMEMNGTLIAAEAYAYHHATIHDDSLPFDPVVRERVLEGGRLKASDYIAALRYHEQMCADWIAWTCEHHALLTPCLTTPPPLLADVLTDRSSPAVFTRAGNFINATGLALPAGFSTTGLPIGIQLLGGPRREHLLTAIGAAFQRKTDWHMASPAISPEAPVLRPRSG